MLLVALGVVDIERGENRTVDAMVDAPVRTDPKEIPATIVISTSSSWGSRPSIVARMRPSRLSNWRFDLICPMGRPTLPGMRLNSRSAAGVKRRTRMSLPTITIGMATLSSRLTRSLLTTASSWLRRLQLRVEPACRGADGDNSWPGPFSRRFCRILHNLGVRLDGRGGRSTWRHRSFDGSLHRAPLDACGFFGHLEAAS
jgi:hypothetical protein